MSDTDYGAILRYTLKRMAAVRSEIDKLDIEAAKLTQLFFATLNMLPDDEKQKFREIVQAFKETTTAKETSLKQVIMNILGQSYPRYQTVTEVRDRLRASGFDFSGYTSNELASISTTLRRFSSSEVETTNIEGVTAYRQSTKAARKAKLARIDNFGKDRFTDRFRSRM